MIMIMIEYEREGEVDPFGSFGKHPTADPWILELDPLILGSLDPWILGFGSLDPWVSKNNPDF